MKRCKLLFLLWLCCSAAAWGQTAMTWDEFVEAASTDENAEREDWDDYLESLYELHLHPVDVNSATLAELKQIPVLSEKQAEDIRFYVLTFGAMKTLGELAAIESIGYDLRRVLPLFLTATPPTPKQRADTLRFRDSKHDLLTRIDQPLYQRKGEKNGSYYGRGVAHRLRYNWSLGKKVEAGFGFEKDACEPMTFPAAYDHWSGHAMMKDVGCVRTLVVGDYRMGWGEGLAINNRFTMGKSAFSTTTSTGITPHRSATESNYLRGVAATVGNVKVQGTIFVSYKMMDARTGKDGYATSLNTTWLHRTDTEMAQRHNQRQTLAGGHLMWRVGKMLTLGATAFGERYYLPFSRGTEEYKRHYPEGNDFWGAAVDYRLRTGRWTLHGETATNGQGFATLNHLNWRHSRHLEMTLSQRYYSRAYHSFMAQAFSESAVQNEHGYYLAVTGEPVRGLTLHAYADIFFRPAPLYRIDHPTQGQDFRLLAAYQFNPRNRIEARAQWKHKEAYYALYVSQKYQLAHTFSSGPWTLRTQAQMHHYSTAKGVRNVGLSLQPTLKWQGKAWRMAVSAAWFKTDDYYSRVYLSQPSLTGTRSAMFYGHGLASAATIRYNWGKRLNLTLRYAVSHQWDRDHTGSGQQTILSPTRNDVSLQLGLKL